MWVESADCSNLWGTKDTRKVLATDAPLQWLGGSTRWQKKVWLETLSSRLSYIIAYRVFLNNVL